MEKSITMTTFTDETLRKEFRNHFFGTDRSPDIDISMEGIMTYAVEKYWLSKFHDYQAYLIAKYGIILDDTDIQQG